MQNEVQMRDTIIDGLQKKIDQLQNEWIERKKRANHRSCYLTIVCALILMLTPYGTQALGALLGFGLCYSSFDSYASGMQDTTFGHKKILKLSKTEEVVKEERVVQAKYIESTQKKYIKEGLPPSGLDQFRKF